MDESLMTCPPNRQYRTIYRELRSMIKIRRSVWGGENRSTLSSCNRETNDFKKHTPLRIGNPQIAPAPLPWKFIQSETDELCQSKGRMNPWSDFGSL
jgi:hypothetical protein